jgi:hypothetical protein
LSEPGTKSKNNLKMIPEGTVEEQGQEKYTSEKEYNELSFVCQNVRFCITDLA